MNQGKVGDIKAHHKQLVDLRMLFSKSSLDSLVQDNDQKRM